MTKKLLFNLDPPIRSYQHHAFALGILLKSSIEYNWLYNNYIQVSYSKSQGLSSFNFYMDFVTHQPVFNREYLSDELIEKNNIDIIDYICKALTEEKHVLACVNEFYIPNRLPYQKVDNIHDVLIWGYDDTNKIFDIAGFDDKSNYSVSQVSFLELKLSKPIYIELLSVNTNYQFNLNLRAIILQLRQYLNEVDNLDLGDVYYLDRTYGIEACFALYESYKEVLSSKSLCDIRPMYLLMEHKKCMIKRMEKINQLYNLDIDFKYNEIVNHFVSLKSLLIKYNHKKTQEIALRILEKFDLAINLEKLYLSEYVDFLVNNVRTY